MAENVPQAVGAVVLAEVAEGRVREVWPSVASFPGIANVGRMLTRTIILAPLAWLIMSSVYFGKLMPFLMRRYTLTNRRLMIRKGWHGSVAQEVPLSAIDEIRVVVDGNNTFFRAADLQIVGGGQVLMTLAGVPDPESFRHAILATCQAWVPGKSKAMIPFRPASEFK
jgi:hypothetical protein